MSWFSGPKFTKEKVKPYLKMAVERTKLHKNKKKLEIAAEKKKIAGCLSRGETEKAVIYVEALIRKDYTLEAMEIIELLCELIAERLDYLCQEKNIPDDMKESIATLLYAQGRIPVKELTEVRKLFKAKYGEKFDSNAHNNRFNMVNENVVSKLSVQPPDRYLCYNYLDVIAKENGVEWVNDEANVDAMALGIPTPAPSGKSIAGTTGASAVQANMAMGVAVPMAMGIASNPNMNMGGGGYPAATAPAAATGNTTFLPTVNALPLPTANGHNFNMNPQQVTGYSEAQVKAQEAQAKRNALSETDIPSAPTNPPSYSDGTSGTSTAAAAPTSSGTSAATASDLESRLAALSGGGGGNQSGPSSVIDAASKETSLEARLAALNKSDNGSSGNGDGDGDGNNGEVPGFDALAARFNRLKNDK